jgi:hypothetical protein
MIKPVHSSEQETDINMNTNKSNNKGKEKLVKMQCDHCARKVMISEENVRTPYYCC